MAHRALQHWAVAICLMLSLVLSPTRAPGGYRAVADTQSRRETAGEVVR